MFSITFNEPEEVTIHFKNETIELSFSPENIDMIKDLKNGYCDSRPYNGEFSFDYAKDVINFDVTNYGNGLSGAIRLTIKNTPEIQKSFDDCLLLWKMRVI